MDHVKFVNFQIKMKFDRLFSKLTLNMAYFFFHLLVARHCALGCCNFVHDGKIRRMVRFGHQECSVIGNSSIR